jgi:hypothetical protein
MELLMRSVANLSSPWKPKSALDTKAVFYPPFHDVQEKRMQLKRIKLIHSCNQRYSQLQRKAQRMTESQDMPQMTKEGRTIKEGKAKDR